MTAAPTEAATRPADPARRTRPPKPALRSLAWVTWRQHRSVLLLLAGAMAFCALILVYFGHKMHADFNALGLAQCYPGKPGQHCSDKIQEFGGDQNRVNQLMAVFLPLPALFGLFIGAPLLAREYESGTCRFVFTQGADRARWLVTKVVLLTAFTLATTVAFTLVVMWWYAPLVPLNGRMNNTIQEIYGAVFVGRAVFALALGVFAGALLRRVVPAIAATLVVWIAVVVPSIVNLRAHLMTPITLVNPLPAAAGGSTAVQADGDPAGWIISDVWRTPTGQVLNYEQVQQLHYQAALDGHKLDFAGYIAQKGYSHTVVYQPLNRFWDMQAIEAGGLAVLSLALLIAAVWLVRRRAA